MLYKRKAITKKFRLRRIKKEAGIPFCTSYKCPLMVQRGDGGIECIDLCYKLSDFNGTYKQYIGHSLRYIGM